MTPSTVTGCVALQVTNFGNPFLLQIGDDETLAHIKQRIQVPC